MIDPISFLDLTTSMTMAFLPRSQDQTLDIGVFDAVRITGNSLVLCKGCAQIVDAPVTSDDHETFF